MNSHQSFSDRLQVILQDNRISKSSLALSLGVSPATITGWLNGKSPTLENLAKVATTLNVSLCWLVKGVGPMRLHGPMHVTKAEEELLLQLRYFPEEVFDHLFVFLAAITNSGSESHLVKRARASKVLSSVGLAMAILDSRHIIRDINAEYLKLLNFEPAMKASIVGSSILDWIPAEQHGQFVLHAREAETSGYLDGLRCDHVRLDEARHSSVILSGAYQSDGIGGFLLLTAFLLPENNRLRKPLSA